MTTAERLMLQLMVMQTGCIVAFIAPHLDSTERETLVKEFRLLNEAIKTAFEDD